jgi:hypothetical protein
MPCDEIRTTTVALNRADTTLLRRALEAEGWSVTETESRILYTRVVNGCTIRVSYDGSDLSISAPGDVGLDRSAAINAVKRAYSAQVVQAASARFGWRVKQQSPTRFTVTRRA